VREGIRQEAFLQVGLQQTWQRQPRRRHPVPATTGQQAGEGEWAVCPVGGCYEDRVLCC
jgi:hypothetical protein